MLVAIGLQTREIRYPGHPPSIPSSLPPFASTPSSVSHLLPHPSTSSPSPLTALFPPSPLSRPLPHHLETPPLQFPHKGEDKNKNTDKDKDKNKDKDKDKDKGLCFVDGGSNVGEHVKQFYSLCIKYKIESKLIYAVEPFPSTIKALKKNLANISFELVEKALGKEKTKIRFFSQAIDGISGQNSAIKHYYLSKSIDVTQTTIDSLVEQYNLEKIDFLKFSKLIIIILSLSLIHSFIYF